MEEEAKWYIDSDTPGEGERPDWLPEKFKTVRDAVESHGQLEKKLGAVPDDYDFGDFKDVFDKDHEAFKSLASFSKEKRVPQEVFTKVLESISDYGKSFLPDTDAEKAKIGDDADRRIEILGDWAESNLTENSAKVLKSMVGDYATADSVLAMEEIRNKIMEKNPKVPSGSDAGGGAEQESIESLQDEMSRNLDKYTNDSKYRSNLQRRIEKVAKVSPYVDKTGI
jgi:hypothetical protein